jgi:phosphatidate cytidylyltransferase
MTEIVKRTITVFLLFFFLSFLYLFGNNTAVIFFISVVSIYSLYEWMSISSKHIVFLPAFIILNSVLYYLDFVNTYYLSIITLLIWVILISSMILLNNQLKIFIKKYYMITGMFIFSSFFLLLTNMYPYDVALSSDSHLIDNKNYLLFFIILISSIDIFAYICGKTFGKNMIVSSISPNKTLEGYLGSYFLTILFFIIFFNTNNLVWNYLDLFYLTIIILLAFFGDLFMSFIKRMYDIKNTSDILPGHGGILDRLDSYFPSLPLFYLWLMI